MNPDDMVHIRAMNFAGSDQDEIRRTWPPQRAGEPLIPDDTGLLITDVDFIAHGPEGVWVLMAVDPTDQQITWQLLLADAISPTPKQGCVGMWRSTVGAYLPPGYTLTMSPGQAIIRGYWYRPPSLVSNDDLPQPDIHLPT